MKQWRKKLDLTAVIKQLRLYWIDCDSVMKCGGMSSSRQSKLFRFITRPVFMGFRRPTNRNLLCQLLQHFEKSSYLKGDDPKRKQRQRLQILTCEQRRQTTAVDRWFATGIVSNKVLQVNCPLLSPSTQVSAVLKTPPPNKGWENGAFLPFARLHLRFGGRGDLLFHFILYEVRRKVK